MVPMEAILTLQNTSGGNTTHMNIGVGIFYVVGVLFSVFSAFFYIFCFILSFWFLYLSWGKYAKKKNERKFHLQQALVNTVMNVMSIVSTIGCQFTFSVSDAFSFFVSFMFYDNHIFNQNASKIRMAYVCGDNPIWLHSWQFAILILSISFFTHRAGRRKLTSFLLYATFFFLVLCFFIGGGIIIANYLKTIAVQIGFSGKDDSNAWKKFEFFQTLMYFFGTTFNFVAYSAFFVFALCRYRCFFKYKELDDEWKTNFSTPFKILSNLYLCIVLETFSLLALNVLVTLSYYIPSDTFQELVTVLFLFLHVVIDFIDVCMRFIILHVNIAVVHRVSSNENWLKEILLNLKQRIHDGDMLTPTEGMGDKGRSGGEENEHLIQSRKSYSRKRKETHKTTFKCTKCQTLNEVSVYL